jgi:polysaccharide pyruvyl transferase WcaK-like protein
LLGQGNLGNDGSMEAVLAYLRDRHPELILDALCSEPDVLIARYGIPAARLRWYEPERRRPPGPAALPRRTAGIALGVVIDAVHTAAWVRRHDAIVVPGMGVLETTVPMRPWRTPYWMFLLCASGRVLGTRIALVSVGANVTGHRLTRWLITSAVRLAHYRSYRDEVSRDAMRSMGVNTSADLVYPDVAFAIPVPRDVQVVPGSVGIGVMDYSGNNDEVAEASSLRANYLAQVTSFGRWLIDNGRRVRLFTSDTADEPVVQEIAADIRVHRPDLDPSFVVAEPATSIPELMRQIAAVETVVATRYHNVLYALLQDKPTLALAYAKKHDLLMATAGLAGFSLPCRTLDARQLIRKFQELEQRSAELRQTIAEYNTAKQRLVDSQLAELSAVLVPEILSAR